MDGMTGRSGLVRIEAWRFLGGGYVDDCMVS